MKAIRWIVFASLVLAPAVHAQQRAVATSQPAAGTARADIAPSALRDAALTVAQAVDAGQAAQLWQSASSVARGAVTQQAFVDSVVASRKPFGKAAQRQWSDIRLRDVAVQQGATTPPGRYGSVEFDTQFGGRKAHELVSFRLDEDGQWRFAGYVIEPRS
ncbi:MAG TPA: DUF4019 domain-containing protein [Stenotrophomonas sp.]|nr:DUF4019 domain-containing protein [Stenotrophomonas sp.]